MTEDKGKNTITLTRKKIQNRKEEDIPLLTSEEGEGSVARIILQRKERKKKSSALVKEGNRFRGHVIISGRNRQSLAHQARQREEKKEAEVGKYIERMQDGEEKKGMTGYLSRHKKRKGTVERLKDRCGGEGSALDFCFSKADGGNRRD